MYHLRCIDLIDTKCYKAGTSSTILSTTISMNNLGLCNSSLTHSLNEIVSNKPGTQMPLHRINSTFKQDKSFNWAGHMIYFKDDETNVRKQYWVITSKLLRMFKNSDKKIEIEAAMIESVHDLSMYDFNATDRECVFTMYINKQKYYCGVTGFAENSVEKELIKVLAENCYKMLQLTNMPYLNIKRNWTSDFFL